jgi:hypothetical protein
VAEETEELESKICNAAMGPEDYQRQVDMWIAWLNATLRKLPGALDAFVGDLSQATSSYKAYTPPVHNEVEMAIDPALLAIDEANRNRVAPSTVNPVLTNMAPIRLMNKAVPSTEITTSDVNMNESPLTVETGSSNTGTLTAVAGDQDVDTFMEDESDAIEAEAVEPDSEMTDAKS